MGLPFDAEDREPGCHCWGLVRRVLAAERQIYLPSYAETSAADTLAIAGEFRRGRRTGPWLPVVAPQAFDVVLMHAAVSGAEDGRRAPIHCGVLVSPRHVLHVEAATHSVAVALDHWSVQPRIVGIYRHEALA